jgi:hypothetical protein
VSKSTPNPSVSPSSNTSNTGSALK